MLEIKKVGCFWGLYYDGALKFLLNSQKNALFIRDILVADLNDEVLKADLQFERLGTL